ncbi:MAG: hypothetical protein V9F04_05065 [Dermatophilaceae bacterium]
MLSVHTLPPSHALLCDPALPTSHALRPWWALPGLLGLANFPSQRSVLAVPAPPALDALERLANPWASGRSCAPAVAGVRVCASGGHANILLNPRRHPGRRLTLLLVRHVQPS